MKDKAEKEEQKAKKMEKKVKKADKIEDNDVYSGLENKQLKSNKGNVEIFNVSIHIAKGKRQIAKKDFIIPDDGTNDVDIHLDHTDNHQKKRDTDPERELKDILKENKHKPTPLNEREKEKENVESGQEEEDPDHLNGK